MSPAEIIQARRMAQIAAMEGRDGVGLSLEEAQDAARAVKPPPRPKARMPKRRSRLTFSAHAKARMAQRGMTASDVYALWRFGEATPSAAETAYCATDRAIEAARDVSAHLGAQLRRLRGAAIIVDDTRCDLVTVLDDGPDTTFRRGRR